MMEIYKLSQILDHFGFCLVALLQLAKRLLPMMISFLRELLLNFIGNVESFTKCQAVSRVYDTLYQSFLDILERSHSAGRNVFHWIALGVVTCN